METSSNTNNQVYSKFRNRSGVVMDNTTKCAKGTKQVDAVVATPRPSTTKKSGVKQRGSGAAKKGFTSRGPLA